MARGHSSSAFRYITGYQQAALLEGKRATIKNARNCGHREGVGLVRLAYQSFHHTVLRSRPSL